MTIKPDVSVAAHHAPKVQLTGVHFARVAGWITNLDDSEGDLGWNLQPISVVWDGDAKSMRVIVPYTMSITKSVAGAPARSIVQIEVFMRLDYSLGPDDTFTPDEQPHVAAILGVMHSWPYFRSEVQALTGKMELPPLTLPTIVSSHVENMATVRQLTEAERSAANAAAQAATATVTHAAAATEGAANG